jgi:hypothetical protein
MWRQRGVSEECRAGCCPHDDEASGGSCPGDLPGAPLPVRVAHLRRCQLLPVQRIAALTGAGREFVTRLLYETVTAEGRPGPARGRAAATWAVSIAEDERIDRVLAHVAREDHLPARVAPPSRRGPSEIELLNALYADPEVCRVLDRHGVPVLATAVLTVAGPPWRRFPAPVPLTADLVGDLYEGCGLSLHHIQLLTGRPAAAAGAVLRASGIKLRPPGGRSPFMDRWRPGED